MQSIIVPITEVVSYLDETLDALWPIGHNVDDAGATRMEVLERAASEFTKAYIETQLRHIRRKPDPLMVVIRELGYPIKVMAEEEVDHLCEVCDDHYMALMLTIDPILQHIMKAIGNRTIECTYDPGTEDLFIEVKGDPLVQHYKELMARVRRLSPPSAIREMEDLNEYSDYIAHSLNEVFKDISDPSVKDEVKRIYNEQLARQ